MFNNQQQAQPISEDAEGEEVCWGNTFPVLILRRITPVFAEPQEKKMKKNYTKKLINTYRPDPLGVSSDDYIIKKPK